MARAMAVPANAHHPKQLLARLQTRRRVNEEIPEPLERQHKCRCEGEGDGDLPRIHYGVDTVRTGWDPRNQHGAEEQHCDLRVPPSRSTCLDGGKSSLRVIIDLWGLRLLVSLGRLWFLGDGGEWRHVANAIDGRSSRDGDGVLRLAFRRIGCAAVRGGKLATQGIDVDDRMSVLIGDCNVSLLVNGALLERVPRKVIGVDL